MFYNDWIDTVDLDDRVEFPFELQGNKFPKKKKNIQSTWSITSWNDDDNFIPSKESTRSDGVDPNSGEWELIATNLTLEQRNKLEEFFETGPPDDRFVFYRERLDSIAPNGFLIEITDFEGEPTPNFLWYNCKISLKNKGVIT